MQAIASASSAPSFVTADGALERDRMRALVFSDVNAKHRLEAILHPLITAASSLR